MKQPTKYLPGFDARHIETYFLHDRKIIAEIFSLSNNTMPDDLKAVQNAFQAKDLSLIREAIHKIKPVFNIVGLLTLEAEVRRFYDLSLEATSFEELQSEYEALLPKLRDARSLINEQTMIFHHHAEKIIIKH